MSEALPAHMQYEEVWGLSGDEPNPQAISDYFRWLAADDDRMESAVRAMQFNAVGFNVLYIARRDNDLGQKVEGLQLNFYHEDTPGNEDPHGHTRLARTTWYAGPDMRQIITRHLPLPQGTAKIDGLPITERQTVAINSVENDGRRPEYRFSMLGTQLVMRQSVTFVAPLGSQEFGSLEVHNVSFLGKSVAVSVHHKHKEEPHALSTIPGLMDYKHLTRAQAEQVASDRELILQELASPLDLSAASMTYPPLDRGNFNVTMQALPPSTDPHYAALLIEGAIDTTSKLAELAA